jgi:hypothetical protein
VASAVNVVESAVNVIASAVSAGERAVNVVASAVDAMAGSGWSRGCERGVE